MDKCPGTIEREFCSLPWGHLGAHGFAHYKNPVPELEARIRELEDGLRVIGGWALAARNEETFRKVKSLLPADFEPDADSKA